ncbi:valine--tRNA ligase [Methanobacterium sp. SMA-27]|uniref:valine--tRNA ligase n=1 Tax=Methanobacterium sp. SMA-27 TaxID=1495336 RepID=UPI00064FD380|nr:valine--tRNA ligase [Methanobacterium sp. SMA-27]
MSKDNIPADYDHLKEAEWQIRWEEDHVHRFIGDGTRPRYIIDTPPPYPTGSIHIGHVLNWTFIDIIARFMRMKGYDVMFPQGWDCHGLPTEVKVEEINNIRKNDVPRDEFRNMCIDITHDNIKQMKSQMQSLGFSQDWSREFVTMTPEYRAKTQLSFLKLYNQNLIYRAVHPVNWCPRCETAIAFAEVDYNENTTFLNYMEFPETNGEGKVIIATTRPELLSACVAVVVHPEDERYKHLEGKNVVVPLYNRPVKIITDTDVDPEFGTGAVMICTFGDKTDVSWVNRYGLDIIEAIDERGLMKEVSGKYVGLTIPECKSSIVEDLKDEGCLVKQEPTYQNVGLCWRCKTPIEILVKKQWFVAVKELENQILETAEEIDWIPEHMKIRLLNWTGSMDWDWCISRQRLFATPIPVWYCNECGKVYLPEPEELPVDPSVENPPNKCECGCNNFTGEFDVLDTWMDSSITPMVIAGWPSPDFKKYYPADLRPQGHDIIRTWAFYTILRCKALTDEKPFERIVVNGMVFGEDGHKMSKSRGNVIAPEAVVNEYGADAMRLWSANSVPGSDVPFDWKDVKNGYKFLRKFWNAFRFINMHIADYNMEESNRDYLNPMDRWILSRLNYLVVDVTENLETYNFADARNKIQAFVWHDFCDEYIEAVKYRLYADSEDLQASKEAAKYALKTVILTSLKLLSPITPHFTDEVNQYLDEDNESIHKKNWPLADKSLMDSKAEKLGEIGVNIIGDIRRFKSATKRPLNTPIKSATIYTTESELYNDLKDLESDIIGTMRIKELKIQMGKPDIQERVVELTPVMSKIGPEFKKDAPSIVKYLESNDPHEIAETIERDGKIVINGLTLTKEYVTSRKEIVGSSGEKVEILHSEELDVVLEIVI